MKSIRTTSFHNKHMPTYGKICVAYPCEKHRFIASKTISLLALTHWCEHVPPGLKRVFTSETSDERYSRSYKVITPYQKQRLGGLLFWTEQMFKDPFT